MSTPTLLDAITRRRCQLRQRAYDPLPLYGKEPPQYGKNNDRGGLAGWSKLVNVSYEQIRLWVRTWPDATNSGILTRNVPGLDLDILNQDAAVACEEFVREKFEERGWFLVRIGLAPKRLVLFRTDQPFGKQTVVFAGAHTEKIEFMGDGQQVVVHGDHPDTRQPYRWHGGEPWSIHRDELPYISADEAYQLCEQLTALLVNDFGYVRSTSTSIPRSVVAARGRAGTPDAEARWGALIGNVLTGRDLHHSTNVLAAMTIGAGMECRSGPASARRPDVDG